MKRFFCAALALLYIVSMLPRTAAAAFDPETVSTPHIVLMDAATGNILYERAAHEQAYPASTTKIMTCILAIEMCAELDEMVTVGDSVENRGSTAGLSRGEEMPLIDMLYGVMLRSGNDAARAVAEHFSGSESAFAEKMNEKAASLGMADTHFVKSNGLHKEDHVTTAFDMALLTQYALQNETFRQIVSRPFYHAGATNKDSDGYEWGNSNRLLYTPLDTKTGELKEDLTYPYATGVKTGDTAQAGRCLVASAQKDGVTLILVLFGDMEGKVSAEYRFENAALFFDWAFQNYAALDAGSLGLEDSMVLPVSGAAADDPENGSLTLDIALSGVTISGLKEDIEAIKADPSQITSTYVLEKTLQAPIQAGDVVGNIYYKYNGNALFSTELIASRSVAQAGAAVASPGASPILVNGSTGAAKGEEKSHAWLFWALLCAGLLIALLVLRYVLTRNSRRRNGRRRRQNYRVYRR